MLRSSGPNQTALTLFPGQLLAREQDPDITLKELQAALLEAHGVQASLSGIDVVLRRLDLTYKKSLIADER